MRVICPLLVAIALIFVGPSSGAQLVENPWLERRPLNFAHQGGEREAPSNTMYAFRTAVDKGADVLELDVHATADGQLVVIHDATVNRTTDGSGRVDAMSLEQVQALDAAYWFLPGRGTVHDPNRPASDFPYRGMATGEVPPPEGFSASDLVIPTLEDVLATFPDVPINIEIKSTVPDTMPYEHVLADLLAAFGRGDDVIVVSFLDHATEVFKAHAFVRGLNVSTATGTAETAVFKGTSMEPGPGTPNPRYQALQVPITFEGIEVVTEEFVADAHANGLAVHVWTINDVPTMCWLLDIGVDGIMTDVPTVLETVLADPAGTCA